jgi:hypothetical protein
MIVMATHELRLIGRRAVWPVALVLHAAAASLFVAIWAPTDGVPLWQASVLQQLAAIDRLVIAVVLTWLSMFVLTDDNGGARRMVDWSAITGRSVETVFKSRIVAVALLALIFISVALPAFAAAAEAGGASAGELAAQLAAMAGFAALCVGVSAAAGVAVRNRVAAWYTAMLCCLLTAVAVRLLETTTMRAIVPASIGLLLMFVSPSGVRGRRLHEAD